MAKRNPEQLPKLTKEYEQIILDGMARYLWIMAYVDAYQEGHLDVEHGPGVDWAEITPPTPPAARRAARDLAKLIAATEGMGMVDLFGIAYEVDSGEPFELHEDPWDILLVPGSNDRPEGVSMAELVEEFGEMIAAESLETGLSWGDDHTTKRKGMAFDPKLPRFEVHFDGTDFSWSGEGGAEGSEPAVRRIRVITETQHPDESEPEIEDDETIDLEANEDDEIVPVAVQFLRNWGAVEASGYPYHPGVWYSQIDGNTNYQTGVVTRRSLHLKNFTEDEARQIYEELTGNRNTRGNPARPQNKQRAADRARVALAARGPAFERCSDDCRGWDVFDNEEGLGVQACDECNSEAKRAGLPTTMDSEVRHLPEAAAELRRAIRMREGLRGNSSRNRDEVEVVRSYERVTPHEGLDAYRRMGGAWHGVWVLYPHGKKWVYRWTNGPLEGEQNEAAGGFYIGVTRQRRIA